MTITYRNGVSIAELVFYFPALAIAIFLAVRHGFRRNAGWLFIIIFCVARIIGPAMQIATIHDSNSVDLYTGSIILQNIGLSPLMLATLGLLSRCLDSIHLSHHTFLNSMWLRLIELVILVALILGIVGGVDASNDFVNSGAFVLGTLSKVAVGLFIACFIAIVIITIVASLSISHAEAGEKRLLLAVALSLPFILCRLVYSSITTFAHLKSFGQLTGSVTILLCVALIEEAIVVVIYESVGLTLRQLPKGVSAPVAHHQVPSSASNDYPANNYSAAPQRQQQQQQQSQAGYRKQDNLALRIAKRTIIGRLVTAAIPKNHEDVEMQDSAYAR